MIEEFALVIFVTVLVFVAPVIVWLIQKRFFSNRMSSLPFKEGETERIEAAFEAQEKWRVRGKPEGQRHYGKAMLTDFGISVWSNGIVAKFCVGRVCEYRFAPFGEISGIYPLKLRGTLSPTRSSYSRDGLQIETIDNMTFVIDSTYHDLTDLIGAIKRASPGTWEKIYRKDEVLWMGDWKGNAYLPRVIRNERPPSRVGEVIRAIESATPRTAGKGSLLLEQSKEDMAALRAKYTQWVAASAVGAPACLIAAWYLMNSEITGSPSSTWLCFLPYFLIALGMLFALMLPVGLLASKTAKPFRIFENGIEVPYYRERTLFRSWGEFCEDKDMNNPLQGKGYLFKSVAYGRDVFVPRRTSGLTELMPAIRKKIGKPENVVAVEKPEIAPSRKAEYGTYAAALVISAVIATPIVLTIYSSYPAIVWLTGFGWIFPPIAMLATVFVIAGMRNLEKGAPRRLNIKAAVAIIVIVLAYFTGSTVFDSTLEPYHMPSPSLEPDPLVSSVAPGLHEGSSMNVTGFIFVRGGETFTFRNVHLTMNLPYEKQSGIRVAEGGTLVMDNVTLDSSPSWRGYSFEILGTARITDSDITGLWGDPSRENYDGGLEIYSDDVTMERVRITGVVTNAVLITNANPTISNSTIEYAGDDGIEMHHSDALVVNTTIRFCDWPIIVGEGSGAVIRGNWIADNRHPMTLSASHPTIEGNMFTAESGPAIEYDFYSRPSLKDNSFDVGGGNPVDKGSLMQNLLCDALVMVVAVLCFAYLCRSHMEDVRRAHARLEIGR